MKTLRLTLAMILAATLRACNPVPCVADTQFDDCMRIRLFDASHPVPATLLPQSNQDAPERQVKHGAGYRGARSNLHGGGKESLLGGEIGLQGT
ncbi:MAG: hypothetical protein WCO56_29595, partial [Verrucomicrobiota bacterium]